MARPEKTAQAERADAAHAPVRMVCFRLAGQRFAIPVDAVAEVIPHRPVTRVPFTPSVVAGVINLRGDVVSVLDLGELLGLGRTKAGEGTCIVIVRAAGRTGGVLVDRIDEMRSFDARKIEPKPPVGAARAAALVSGVVTLTEPEDEAGAPCSVLDMQVAFGLEELLGADRAGGGAGRHEAS
ncbi:MAG: purine-binding chemotaxis protein CheW [Myxococcales bacterium]|nr:purine-binding chemotaxis protein CheW [Myxococcales bacterium]